MVNKIAAKNTRYVQPLPGFRIHVQRFASNGLCNIKRILHLREEDSIQKGVPLKFNSLILENV